MIEKIITSGHSGVAVAALDVAIKLGIAYGGWCLEGVSIPDKYRLERLPGTAYGAVTEKGIATGQGTLYFTEGEVASLRLERTKEIALRLNKPLVVLNLARQGGFSASRRIAEWITENRIKVLHVSGEGDGQNPPSAATSVANILEATFFLAMMDAGIPSPMKPDIEPANMPVQESRAETMQAALDHLEQTLPLKDKAIIGNMAAAELISLHATLGAYINTHFDLFSIDSKLLTDCRRRSNHLAMPPEDAVAVIIRALWNRLRTTCRIRIIK
jgi:hypothetical protein